MVDYKLRLGDGTTFSVDEKGLNTWLQGGLVDDKARVQPAGSKKWFSLKQVLAAQGAQRGHAERQTEKGRAAVDKQAAEEVAEIERRVAEQRAAEERKAAEDLAAAERKAEEDRTAAERQLLEDRANAERRAAEELKAAAARAVAEKKAEQERLEAEKRAEEERAAAERSAAEAAEAARVAEAEKQVAAERAERAERKRKAEEARLEAERRAAEDARLEAERKAAEELAAAREAERVAEAERLVAAERAERAERKRHADEERLAEQRVAGQRVEEQRAEERLAKERAAEDLAAKEQAVRDRAIEAFHVPDSAEPPATEIAIEPAATMVKVEDFERELGLVPVAFSDGMDAAGAPVAPAIAGRAAASPSSPERAPSPPGTEAPAFMAIQTPAAVDNAVLRLVKVLDVAVVGMVRTLGPLVGHTIARAVHSLRGVGAKLKALLARRATPPAVPPNTVAEPAPPVAPSAAAPAVSVPAPPAAAPRPAPPATAPGPATAPWAAAPPAPWVPPSSAKSPTPAPRAAPIKPATPPPSFDKIEVIPFAAAPVTSKVADDVWEDEDEWQEPSRVSSAFSVLWLWVKRVTIATALIVAAALLALNREKWLPQAKSAAIVLGEGVDKLSERASTRTVPPQAIEAAHAQAPHLRPDTIELVMSRSTEGVLDPAEVFRRAHVAAEHARASLPPHVVGELDSLTAAVTAGLEEGEAARLRAYLADVRAGTPTADYQDKEAVWLMARGARRLPAERVARLQELMNQAVAAGLEPPPQK